MAEGIQVAAVLCVAVTQSGGAESLAVIIDNHRTEHNLVASVPVNIGNLIVMESVAKPGVVPSAVAVPAPALGEGMGGGVYI